MHSVLSLYDFDLVFSNIPSFLALPEHEKQAFLDLAECYTNAYLGCSDLSPTFGDCACPSAPTPFAKYQKCGKLVDQGTWDAALGTYPSSTEPFWAWQVASNGIIDSISYEIGDWIVANEETDAPNPSTFTIYRQKPSQNVCIIPKKIRIAMRLALKFLTHQQIAQQNLQSSNDSTTNDQNCCNVGSFSFGSFRFSAANECNTSNNDETTQDFLETSNGGLFARLLSGYGCFSGQMV